MACSGLTKLCVLLRDILPLYHGLERFGSYQSACIRLAGTIRKNGSNKMILITGASGSVGKAVLQEAIRTGSKVRGMFRSKEDAAKAPSECEAVLADYADKQSLRKALDGVSAVYVVCSPIPQLVDLESNMVDACKEAGVKHVVLNSALGAGDYPKSFPAGTAR